ncbi:MAG: hypothetical protein R3C03_09810 [Pirellulaceae bacterium]
MSNPRPEISEIRKQVKERLQPLVGEGDVILQQSFLVSKANEYVGVRFRYGTFVAKWTFGAEEIEITNQGELFENMAVSQPNITAAQVEQVQAEQQRRVA